MMSKAGSGMCSGTRLKDTCLLPNRNSALRRREPDSGFSEERRVLSVPMRTQKPEQITFGKDKIPMRSTGAGTLAVELKVP